MAFYSKSELLNMGIASVGEKVFVSNKASIYNPTKIHLGSNIRIDDFCILSPGDGGIFIEDYTHIACNVTLIGRGKIHIKEFVGISSRVAIYSNNDDYTGTFLTNPTVPTKYTNVTVGEVTIGKHVLIGSGVVIIPNVHIGDGCSIGALSFINKSCDEFGIYAGVPAKRIKERKRDLLEKEMQLKRENIEIQNLV